MISRWVAARAAARVGRRDISRNRGRSALIALMIALPVLAMSTASVIYRSDQAEPRDVVRMNLGDQAQAAMKLVASTALVQDPSNSQYSLISDEVGPPSDRTEVDVKSTLQSQISSRDRLHADVVLYVLRPIQAGGQKISARIREIDYTASGLNGLVEQRSGRAPGGPDEVVITEKLARSYGTRVGDALVYTPARNGPARTLTVVGIVDGPGMITDTAVIGAPGTLIAAADRVGVDYDRPGRTIDTTWLVTGPDPVTWSQVRALNRLGATVTSRQVLLNPPSSEQISKDEVLPGDSSDAVIGITVVVVGLVLLQIALLAGPAIAVGARRHQRGLAIMASTGAERRHLRTVVLATSGVIGLTAGAVAAGLGGVLGAGIVGWQIHTHRQDFARIDVHLLDLLALAAVGGLTAVAAALIPARQAARLDVVAVLTGRRGHLPPRRRVPVAGLLLAGVGAGAAYVFSGHGSAFSTVAALALTEIGLIAATGAVLALVARAAVRAPFSLRFALRDAARQRSRTVPAVAAVLAALAGASCALVFLASSTQQERDSYRPQAPYGLTTVRLGDGFTAADPVDAAEVEAAIRRTLPVAEVRGYQALFENSTDSHRYAWLSPMPRPGLNCPADPSCRGGGGSWAGPSRVFDDGSVYPLLTGRPDPGAVAALRAGRVVVGDPNLIWPDGKVHIAVGKGNRDRSGTQSERTVMLPGTVITAPVAQEPIYPLSAVSTLGVNVSVQGLLATTTRMPTGDEEERLRLAVEDVGGELWIERGYQTDMDLVLLSLVIAALVIGLGGTFTAVGLAAAESRADLATLAAVGASPGVRRRLVAGQAGVIAGIGSGLGVLSGVLAGWVLVRLQVDHSVSAGGWFDPPDSGWALALPWWHLLAVGVGVPLAATAVGYLTTRSRLPLIRRLGQ